MEEATQEIQNADQSGKPDDARCRGWGDGWTFGFHGVPTILNDDSFSVGYIAGQKQREQNERIKAIMNNNTKLSLGEAYMTLIRGCTSSNR